MHNLSGENKRLQKALDDCQAEVVALKGKIKSIEAANDREFDEVVKVGLLTTLAECVLKKSS